MIAFVERSFKGARLREKQNAKMRFEIPQQEDKTLGAMFGFIEVCTRFRLPKLTITLSTSRKRPPATVILPFGTLQKPLTRNDERSAAKVNVRKYQEFLSSFPPPFAVHVPGQCCRAGCGRVFTEPDFPGTDLQRLRCSAARGARQSGRHDVKDEGQDVKDFDRLLRRSRRDRQ